MIATLTNLTNRTLNQLDTLTVTVPNSPASLVAVGGNRTDPLPYPFDEVVLAPFGTTGFQSSLPIHPKDFNHKTNQWGPHIPAEEWNRLVAAGIVGVTWTGAEATNTDQEELFQKGL